MFALGRAAAVALMWTGLVVAPVSSEQHLEAAQEAVDAGNDSEAAAEFAAAYDLLPPPQRVSELGALVVDEAADAHRRLHESDGEQRHLEAERELLRRHLDDLDSEGDDPVRRDLVFTRLTDVERRLLPSPDPLLRAPRRGSRERKPEPRQTAERPAVRSRGDGRGLWISGVVTLAAGGLQTLVGVGLGGHRVARGREFSENLKRDNAAFEAAGCRGGESSGECAQLENNITTWRRNGSVANQRAALAFTAAAVGVLAVGLGVGLYVAGSRRRTKAASKRRASVSASGWALRF